MASILTSKEAMVKKEHSDINIIGFGELPFDLYGDTNMEIDSTASTETTKSSTEGGTSGPVMRVREEGELEDENIHPKMSSPTSKPVSGHEGKHFSISQKVEVTSMWHKIKKLWSPDANRDLELERHFQKSFRISQEKGINK